MNYNIDIAQVESELFEITITVYDDSGAEVLTGKTSVNCETLETAQEYAKSVFLPDLKFNFEQLENLVITAEVLPSDTEQLKQG